MPYTHYPDVEFCVDRVIQDLNKNIVVGIPLGLGKPNQLVNELYRRAKADSSITLRIITALSLQRPTTAQGLESKFLQPVFERIFEGYVGLDYAADVNQQCVPANIQVLEFFVKSGSMLNNNYAQQHYISCNYTAVARDMIGLGLNLVLQQVSRGEYQGKDWISLSSNTDISIDLLPLIRREQACGKAIKIVAMVNQQMPFMLNDALCDPNEFDYIVDNPDYYTTLFSPPNMPISTTDFAIGMHTSSLIKDAGTLQIGIGSMGGAIVTSCLLRQNDNVVYNEVLNQLCYKYYADVADTIGGRENFDKGLYSSSEMLVNGFLHLIKNGIMKRKVYENYYIQKLVNQGKLNEQITPEILDHLVESGFFGDMFQRHHVETATYFGLFNNRVNWQQHQLFLDDQPLGVDPHNKEALLALRSHGMGTSLKHGIIISGGFFLGPRDFYKALNQMSEQEKELICMTGIAHVNQLLVNEKLVIEQRQHARFINTGLMATINGAVVSDGLENGKVVSGVGGQYDFVSMAQTLPGARSIILIRSTRTGKEGVTSNIVYNYGHTTIPRHLRDIVVTEYGVADLRAKTDSEVIIAMLNIADSRFQQALLEEAKLNGKIAHDYDIPAQYRKNLPERVNSVIENYRRQNIFNEFPLGSDFTDEELIIAKCLQQMKEIAGNKFQLLKVILTLQSGKYNQEKATVYLQRMEMLNPGSLQEKLQQKLFLYVLKLNGAFD